MITIYLIGAGVSMFIWFLLILPRVVRNFRRDWKVGLASPLLIFVQETAIGFGIVWGLLTLVYNKLRSVW